MSLLEKLVARHACRTIHDVVAIVALGHLQDDDSTRWKNLVLANHDDLLRGVRAPQAKFKDFPNHVLHIREGEWGGLRGEATKWYAEAVASLRARKWHKAAYAFGVLGFYYASACHPLNTHQSEEKAAIKTAFDRVAFRAWSEIQLQLAENGYPTVNRAQGRGFVSTMIVEAATLSSNNFDAVIDTFDFATAASGDDSFIDADLVDIYADFVGRAVSGLASLMDQAIDEAQQSPRKVPVKLLGYLAAPAMPFRAMKTKRQGKAADRQVARMFVEYETSGKVLKRLPPEERVLRKLYAEQILRVSLKSLDQTALTAIGRLVVEKPAEPEANKAKSAEDTSAKPAASKARSKTKRSRTQSALPAILPELEEDDDAAGEDNIPDTLDEMQAAGGDKTDTLDTSDLEGDEIELEFDADTQAQIDEGLNEPLDADLEAELTAEMEAEIAAEIAAELAAESEEDQDDEIDREFALDDNTEWSPGKLSPDALVADALLLDELIENELHAAGIMTVEDLLCVDVEELTEFIDDEEISEDMITNWQSQVMLMMRVGGLRPLDAQILIATGIRTADELASSSASDVFKAARSFLDRQIGNHLLDPEEADIDESDAQTWIDLANQR